MYPSLPAYFPAPSKPSYYVPTFYRLGTDADTYKTVLIAVLIAFGIWDGAMTLLNYGTAFKLLELHQVLVTIAVVFLFFSAALKLYSFVVGIITVSQASSNTLATYETVQIVTIFINVVGLLYLLVISVGQISIGSLAGLVIDYLLHAAVAMFSALLYKAYPHSGWIMVPQIATQY